MASPPAGIARKEPGGSGGTGLSAPKESDFLTDLIDEYLDDPTDQVHRLADHGDADYEFSEAVALAGDNDAAWLLHSMELASGDAINTAAVLPTADDWFETFEYFRTHPDAPSPVRTATPWPHETNTSPAASPCRRG